MIDTMLSIIMPVYNAEQYINRAIDSVLCQSYTNFELIIIDDGSCDNTGDICDAYQFADKRIKVVHQTNSGVSSARNFGVSLAAGKYIGFLDQDDWVEPNMYKLLIDGIEEKGTDIAVGGYIEDYGKYVNMTFKKEASKVFTSMEALEKMFDNAIYGWTVWDKIYKKNLFDEMSLFPDKIQNGEDFIANYKLFTKATSVLYVPLYQYHWIQREDSASHKFKKTNLAVIMAIKIVMNSPMTLYAKRQVQWIYYSTLLYLENKMIHLNDTEYQNEIERIQEEVKDNINTFLKLRKIPFRKKLEMIYYYFPYNIRIFITKNKHKWRI